MATFKFKNDLPYYITLDFTQEEDTTVDTDLKEVTVNVAKFRNKWQTTITGLTLSDYDCQHTEKQFLKLLKGRFSCNGHYTADENMYTLQGDHKRELVPYLVSVGIPKAQIIQSGTS